MSFSIKKKTPLFFTVVLFVICFAGCMSSCRQKDSGQKHQANPVEEADTITIWAWDENYNIVAIGEAITSYQKEHPQAKFTTVTMSQEEVVAKLGSALLTGSTKTLPDIVLVEDYRIQQFLQNYEQEFVNLNEIASPSEFAGCKTGVNQIGDKMYGIPFDSGVVGLFYRADYIAEAGYTDEDMADLTWEKYIEIGTAVKEKTGKYMLTLDPDDLPIIRMMLQSAGAWYTNEQGELDLEDNQALKDAIAIYQDIVDSGIAKTIADWNQFIYGFQSGDVASVVSGSWISSSITEVAEQNGLWRVVPLPRMQNNEDSINASSVGGSGWYVLKNGGHAEEAMQFLAATFVSDQQLINNLVEKINLVSTLKKAENSENYEKGVPFYGGQMIYQDFIKWTYEIPSVNYGAKTYEVESVVAEAIQKILSGEEMDNVLSEYQRKSE